MKDSPEDEPWPAPDLAERLLDGKEIAQESAGSDPRIADLARLLTAADGTLAGRADDERAALQAFAREFTQAPAQARGGVSGRSVRRSVRGSRGAKAMIGGAAALFALGGVAIAAQTGALPRPFHSGTSAPVTGKATTAPATPSNRQSIPKATGATRRPAPFSPPPVTHPQHTTGAPEVPGLKGLCESHLKAAQRGRSLDSPSLSRLEEAAGSAAGVDAYCSALTSQPGGHTPSPASHPTHPTHPATARRK
ncbi:hypothetical protein [Actinacidiphila paucisporea]|uniref:Uncharacterized protein n=1 Tax=Actinacidiphila paucisporea TaxID=310782 RepID=A0A1M7R045_9ACTN|nr:hypothetical protein [Actinacidiphila paucisporea]SHN37653.1 hypothetical protein SAMN05216499_1554 [Actinacidiphila paucisporea]